MEEIHISTDSVEPHLRAEYWREICSVFHSVAPVDINTEIDGRLSASMFGPFEAWSTKLSAQRYLRDRRAILRGRTDRIMVLLALGGGTVGDFNGRDVRVRPGDIFCIDTAQPYQSVTEANSRFVLFVPREPLEKRLGGKNLHGLVLSADQPMTPLLTTYLQGLHASALQLSSDELSGTEEALYVLLATSMAGKDSVPAEALRPIHPTLRASILTYIDDHIGDPSLSPASLARQFRMSRTHLYRIFGEDGTIAGIIREKRLDLAWRQLHMGPQHVSQVKQLAAASGFCNTEHFARLFKQRFGVQPSQVLTQSADMAGPEISSYFQHFARYRSAEDWRPKTADSETSIALTDDDAGFGVCIRACERVRWHHPV